MSYKFFMLDDSDKSTLCDIFEAYTEQIGRFCANDVRL